MERALRVGTRQDTRAVELVDFCRELVSRLHVGNCVIRHSVDGLVGILCAVEDVDELAARDRRVHLRRSIACIILFDNAVCDCVRNVAVIPVDTAVFQVDLTLMLHLIERGGELDRLRDSQCAVGLELRLRNAVDQTDFPRFLHALTIPCRLRNIGERKLFFLSFRLLVYAGVRADRLDSSAGGLRRLVQLRNRYICNCFRSICIFEFAAALAANPVFDVAVGFCCRFYTVDMAEIMTFCRDRDGI